MAGKVDDLLIALSHLALPLHEAAARLASRRDEAMWALGEASSRLRAAYCVGDQDQ